MTGTEIEPRRPAPTVAPAPQIIEVPVAPTAGAARNHAWISQGLAILSDVVRLALQVWPEKTPAASRSSGLQVSSPATSSAAATPVPQAAGGRRGWRRRRRQRGRW